MTYVDDLTEELEAKMEEHRAAMEAVGKMLKALRAKPQIAPPATKPPKAKARKRTNQLPITDDQLADALMVTAETFTAAELGAVVGRTPRQMGPACAGWVRRGLLEQAGEGRYRRAAEQRTTPDAPADVEPRRSQMGSVL